MSLCCKQSLDFISSDNSRNPYLEVLAWDFYFVEFTVLELHEPMTEDIERLQSWPRLENLFVLVSPNLKLPDIFAEVGLGVDNIGLEQCLKVSLLAHLSNQI